MVGVHRLILALLLAVAALPGPAQAQTTETWYSVMWRTCSTVTTDPVGMACDVFVSTQAAACTAMVGKLPKDSGVGNVATSTFDGSQCVGSSAQGYGFNAPLHSKQVITECAAPTELVNGQCVDVCAKRAGDNFVSLFYDGGEDALVTFTASASDDAPTLCDVPGSAGPANRGCAVRGIKQMGACQDGKCQVWQKQIKFTGSSCTGLEASVTPSVPNTGTGTGSAGTTAPGKCAGTFNGVAIEHNCASASTPTTSSATSVQTSNPDGSTSTTSITKTESTSCSNGVCTTTTTTSTGTKTTPVTGSETMTVTSSKVDGTATQGAFCSANKDSPICGGGEGEKSSFGGSCSAFTCTGDAAMCAIAKATQKMKCQLDAEPATMEISAYESAKNAGTATGITTANVTISSSSFDTTNALSQGAGCIGDLPIVVMGKSITLPISGICPYLTILGNLMLAISFLSAIVIVGRPT